MKLSPVIIINLAIASIICVSCSNDVTTGPAKNQTDEGPANSTPPGSVINEKIPEEYLYKDLGYDKGLFTREDKPFTGTAVQHHANGKLKSRYQLVDGMLDGIIEEWWDNGQRSTYKQYKENMRHGITTYWDENGVPTKQVLYKDDEEVEEKVGDQIPKDLGI
jgi:hypothetical protein